MPPTALVRVEKKWNESDDVGDSSNSDDDSGVAIAAEPKIEAADKKSMEEVDAPFQKSTNNLLPGDRPRTENISEGANKAMISSPTKRVELTSPLVRTSSHGGFSMIRCAASAGRRAKVLRPTELLAVGGSGDQALYLMPKRPLCVDGTVLNDNKNIAIHYQR